MAELNENKYYPKEYNTDLVSCWDDLIGWDSREEGERQFLEADFKHPQCLRQ